MFNCVQLFTVLSHFLFWPNTTCLESLMTLQKGNRWSFEATRHFNGKQDIKVLFHKLVPSTSSLSSHWNTVKFNTRISKSCQWTCTYNVWWSCETLPWFITHSTFITKFSTHGYLAMDMLRGGGAKTSNSVESCHDKDIGTIKSFCYIRYLVLSEFYKQINNDNNNDNTANNNNKRWDL